MDNNCILMMTLRAGKTDHIPGSRSCYRFFQGILHHCLLFQWFLGSNKPHMFLSPYIEDISKHIPGLLVSGCQQKGIEGAIIVSDILIIGPAT